MLIGREALILAEETLFTEQCLLNLKERVVERDARTIRMPTGR